MWHKIITVLFFCLKIAPSLGMNISQMQTSNDDIRGMLLTHKGQITRYIKNQDFFLETGQSIKTGDTISTRESSTAVFVLKSNSILIIGPKTTFTIGQHGSDQLQHIHVHSGYLKMLKHPSKSEYLDATVFTFAHDPHIYQAQAFEVELTPEQESLVLLKGKLNKISQ